MAALHFAHNHLVITIVGILGNIVSGMVYLAPLPTYYRIYRKKSTESFESMPYVVALFSAMLWIYYAILKTKEYYLVSIKVGCVIEALYIVIYLAYASKTARICRAKLFLSLNLAAFSMIVIIIQLIPSNSSKRVLVLGYLCAIVSIAVYAAPLSIMVKVIQTKSVEFMPFALSFFLTVCAVIWLVYGLLRQDLFISIPNIFGFVLGLLQMTLYIICKHCCFSKGLIVHNNLENGIGKVIVDLTNVDNHPKIDGKHQEQNQSTYHVQLDRANEVQRHLASLDNAVVV
ncbi:bidirectional sugar transporter SWEET15-like [Silene latifolia]|uniref:bidirectional sugar transporter SWEET15-like n=1 Tax=Silene latifolia TaxID=37657 RepID=UPI003D777891